MELLLPLPQYAFMAWCSVKNRAQGQLYLTLPLPLSLTKLIARNTMALVLKTEYLPTTDVKSPGFES